MYVYVNVKHMLNIPLRGHLKIVFLRAGDLGQWLRALSIPITHMEAWAPDIHVAHSHICRQSMHAHKIVFLILYGLPYYVLYLKIKLAMVITPIILGARGIQRQKDCCNFRQPELHSQIMSKPTKR